MIVCDSTSVDVQLKLRASVEKASGAQRERIGDGVSFYELDDFSVVVCRPGKRIIYSHCRWSNIEELGKLGEPVAEKVTVISCKRMETDA